MTKSSKTREGSLCYKTLRKAILRLEIRPGAVLDEASLVEELKVSRTPVREAIIQLIADGLVIREGRSARVAPLDIDIIPQLYDALLISSRMIHRLSSEFRTETDLAMIKEHMEDFEAAVLTVNGVALSEANFQFHLAISASAKNHYFSEFYERVLAETLRFARACFSGSIYGGEDLETHLKETARQHRAIFKTIEDKDFEAADHLAEEHCKLTRSRIVKIFGSGSKSLNSTPNLG